MLCMYVHTHHSTCNLVSKRDQVYSFDHPPAVSRRGGQVLHSRRPCVAITAGAIRSGRGLSCGFLDGRVPWPTSVAASPIGVWCCWWDASQSIQVILKCLELNTIWPVALLKWKQYLCMVPGRVCHSLYCKYPLQFDNIVYLKHITHCACYHTLTATHFYIHHAKSNTAEHHTQAMYQYTSVCAV